MAPRDIGSQTDPSTLAGGGQNPSELGGGGALQLLEEKNPQAYIDQLEFSEPNASAPADNATVYSQMDGSGTVEDPKIITNDQELQAMRAEPESNYALGANIDCSLMTEWNGGVGYKPPGWSTYFKGSLDGRGHVIKNLYHNNGNTDAGLFSSFASNPSQDAFIKNVVLYNFDLTAQSGDDAAAVAGSFYQNEAPDEYRKRVEDVLVIDCSISGGSVAGITSYSSIAVDVKRCGVVGCDITSTQDDTQSHGVSPLVGIMGGYDWGTNSDLNYQIFEDLYVYDNTVSPGANDTGAIAGQLRSAGSFVTSGDYWTSISGVFIDDSDPNIPVIGETQIDSDTQLTRVAPVYVEGGRVYASEETGAASGSEEVNIVSLTSDEIRGESVTDLATAADFNSVWTTVEQNTDLSIFADGYPVLDGDYNRLQAAAQGLGDPFIGSVKGVTPAGDLVNVNSIFDVGNYRISDPNTPRIGQIYPSNTRLSSAFQGVGGAFTSIPNVPRTTGSRYAVAIDPQNPERMVRVGGDYTDDTNTQRTITEVFNASTFKYESNVYPDISDDITELNATSLTDGPVVAGVGDYIVVAGGRLGVDGNATDAIHILDTTASSPTWTRVPDTCPSPTADAHYCTYNGELWVLGGYQYDGFVALNEVFKIDPAAADNERVDTSPTNLPQGVYYGGERPVYNGKTYLVGYFSSDGTQMMFYSYDLETQETEELPNVEGIYFEGEQETTYGPTYADAWEYNGYLYFTAGSSGHDEVDIMAYNPETRSWTSVPPDISKQEGEPLLASSVYESTIGAKSGKTFGNVRISLGSGAYNGEADDTEAYIIPEDPTEVNR